MVKDNKENEKDKKIASLFEDLALLESYAQELFSFTPLPLFFASPNGVILEANPALEEITKRDIYEIIGEGIEIIFEKEEIYSILKDTLKKGAIHDKEIFIIDKNGNKIITSIFSQARKNKEGTNIGCFFGVFDLTEIKRKEEALKESSQVLEIKVAAKTRELTRLNESLEASVKERTQDLEEKLEQIERTNKLMVGRELKMIELKEELEESRKKIDELKKKLKEENK